MINMLCCDHYYLLLFNEDFAHNIF